jgi:uracil-DNA glycosylase
MLESSSSGRHPALRRVGPDARLSDGPEHSSTTRSPGRPRSRETTFLTSVEKHFPPGNRRPTRAEVDACKPVLLRQLEVVDPRIVVLLGRVAERALAGEPVMAGRCVLATAHPAAMRFPWVHRRFLRDLHKLRQPARRL